MGPVKPLLRTMRGALLAIWGLGRAATTDSQTARAVFALSLMIGGSILAVALLSDDVPGFVVVVGAVLVAAGAVVLALAVWSWKALPIILGVLGLTLAIAFIPRLLVEAGVDEDSRWVTDGRWIFPIVAAVVGTYVLGIARRGWVANTVAIVGILGLVALLAWGVSTASEVWLLRIGDLPPGPRARIRRGRCRDEIHRGAARDRGERTNGAAPGRTAAPERTSTPTANEPTVPTAEEPTVPTTNEPTIPTAGEPTTRPGEPAGSRTATPGRPGGRAASRLRPAGR